MKDNKTVRITAPHTHSGIHCLLDSETYKRN